jgi:hypothetical protein
MDKGERLSAFLTWARDSGVTAEHVNAMREIAVALLDASRGGRVTESHILQVADKMSAGTPQQQALCTECGELFLLYEDALRQAGTPSAAPSKLGTYLPRKSTPEGDTPRPSRPPESPADVGPLRPPERLTGSRAARLTEPPSITPRSP